MITIVLVNAQVLFDIIPLRIPSILFRFETFKESLFVGIVFVVCDGTFFPELLKEMEDVVGWFNENAQKLLELHLASGFTKCLTWFKGNSRKKDHLGLIQEGKDLVNYALINAVAIRKILKKYDKVIHLNRLYPLKIPKG